MRVGVRKVVDYLNGVAEEAFRGVPLAHGDRDRAVRSVVGVRGGRLGLATRRVVAGGMGVVCGRVVREVVVELERFVDEVSLARHEEGD